MAQYDAYNLEAQNRETPIKFPQAAPAPNPAATAGPTGFWSRIGQVGIGQMTVLNALKGVGKVGKAVGNAAISSERTVATGIARELPGGLNDVKAQEAQAAGSVKNAQFLKDQAKSGKISKPASQKLMTNNAQESAQNQKENTKTVKAMPTKGELAAGFAGTALDVVTAGGGTIAKEGAKYTAEKGAQKLASGDLVKKIPDAFKIGDKSQKAVTATASAANAAANAKSTRSSGKQTALQAGIGAVIPYAGTALRGVKSITGRVISKGEAKTAQAAAQDVLDKEHVDDLTRTTKVPVEDKSQATQIQVNRPNAPKLLPATTKSTANTEIKGKGFTATEIPDAQKVKLSARLSKINNTLTKVAQGKVSMHPDEVKSLAVERTTIGKIARGDAQYSDFYGKSTNSAKAVTPAATSAANSGSKTPKALTTPTAKTPSSAASKKITEPNVPGTSKVAGSSVKIEKSAVEQGLTKRMSDLPEYETINKADQAQKVTDLINNDRQRAIDVIDGKRSAPDGIHPTAIHNGLVQLARKTGDGELITKLAQSKVNTELSKSAQNLSLAAERDPHDPVELVRQVMAARTKAVEGRTSGTVNKAITKTVQEIDKSIKKPSKFDWQSFVEGIKC